jgi:3-oxoacyl-[acyl-carrier-protein] synthase II
LRDARLEPEQISYINAHGTGTEANDKAECKAVRRVFGDLASRVPMSSTKSIVGHCLGAAGAIEVVASIVCAEAGVLPPTASFAGAREGCPVDCVPQSGRPWNMPRIFLSNNSAFGGHNASLVLAVENDSLETVREPRSSRREWAPSELRSPRSKSRIGQSLLVSAVTGEQRQARPPAVEGCGRQAAPDLRSTRIFVTGCGVVSALGAGEERLAEALRQGHSGLREVCLDGLPPFLAGLADERTIERVDRRLDLRHMDRSSRWATVAARLALRDAGLEEKTATLTELGLFLNLSAGPSWAEAEFLTSFLSNRHQVKELMAFPYIVPSSVAGNVCRALRLSGTNATLSLGPGAGLLGLGPAVSALRAGHAEALLCGAVDELSERILTDHFLAGLPSDEAAWPQGEGAAVLMLETQAHAQARGATALVEISGLAFGTCVGASDGGAPSEDVLLDALKQAELTPSDVAVWCPDGPGHVIQQIEKRLCPAWRARTVTTRRQTGWLEGSQPLLNLAAALHLPLGQGPIVLFSISDQGVTAAAVLQRPG